MRQLKIAIVFKNLGWILLPGLFFYGCRKENLCDCFKGRGSEKTEIRTVSPFHKLVVHDKIDVYYTQSLDSSYEVKIQTGKNLIKLVKVKAENDVLEIRNGNKCNFVRGDKNDIKVFVKAPYIHFIEQQGVGKIYCVNTITQDYVDYNIRNSGDVYLDVNCTRVIGHMHGIGDVYIKGNCNEHATHVTGQGFVNAYDLNSVYTWIYFYSNGKAMLTASDKLIGFVMSTGNIYLRGLAQNVDVQIAGKGKFIRE